MLLTRLPVARLTRLYPAERACVWAYPLVGALVGGAGAAVLWAALALRVPPAIAAILALAATMALTGALHEDGLADMADGFGGGATPARKLEIMRDSRIGSYGTLALILSVGVRVAALSACSHPALALLLAGVLGRGAMVGVLATMGPARSDGLTARLGDAGRLPILAGIAIAAAASLLAPAALLAAALAAYAVMRLARRQVGGYTGDVLGAAEQCVECAVLIVLTTE